MAELLKIESMQKFENYQEANIGEISKIYENKKTAKK